MVPFTVPGAARLHGALPFADRRETNGRDAWRPQHRSDTGERFRASIEDVEDLD
jgi:hypothetical protein